jgi:hypothetical protein
MINWIKNVTEGVREALAWKIFPEFGIYVEVAKIIGSSLENDRVVKILEDSDFRYKDGAIKLIKNTYTSLDVEEHFGSTSDIPL